MALSKNNLDFLSFHNPTLLQEALTHPSYALGKANVSHNERLEFFGDAVLKLIVSEYLFNQFSDYDEGQLTKLRAWIVSDKTLVVLAELIDLSAHLRLSKSERRHGGAERFSTLANAFEALLGALYLDQGIDAVKEFLIPKLSDHIMPLMTDDALDDYKTALQEAVQKYRFPLPIYTLVETDGPDHDKRFIIEVCIQWHGRSIVARGKGTSKKQAEQDAAKALLKLI